MKKIMVVVLMVELFFPFVLLGNQIDWQNISPNISEVKDVLVSFKNSSIYIATSQGIF